MSDQFNQKTNEERIEEIDRSIRRQFPLYFLLIPMSIMVLALVIAIKGRMSDTKESAMDVHSCVELLEQRIEELSKGGITSMTNKKEQDPKPQTENETQVVTTGSDVPMASQETQDQLKEIMKRSKEALDYLATR